MQPPAQAETFVESIRFASAAELVSTQDRAVGDAVATFIGGMAGGDAEAVWQFASEEDQAAFETEAALYAAFADVFPVLTQATDVNLESIRSEGDTPFVELAITDAAGDAYKATIGFWLDDAGDWKVISCEIRPATERLATLF